jgi:hypothetical protein
MTVGADMRVRYRYLVEDRDRHGNTRIYVRFPGFKKIRIRETLGTSDFAQRYAALLGQFTSGQVVEAARKSLRPVSDTLGWLTTAYRSSAEFKALDISTQRTRTRVLESMLSEPVHPGAKESFQHFPPSRPKESTPRRCQRPRQSSTFHVQVGDGKEALLEQPGDRP